MKKLVIICALAFFAVACETKVDMTWQFTKALDTANPTIGLYDHTDGNAVLNSSIKLDNAVTTVTVSCTSGNVICFGGDFTLASEEFVLGCGAGCADYDPAYAAESCAECEETTIYVTFDNFLF
jgi:hypothetical protein